MHGLAVAQPTLAEETSTANQPDVNSMFIGRGGRRYVPKEHRPEPMIRLLPPGMWPKLGGSPVHRKRKAYRDPVRSPN
jgi:hypothetical protein